jgi:hypothetical protein
MSIHRMFGWIVGAAGIVTVLAGFAFNPAGALAATYYVDPATGSDSNAGTSQTAPWRTIPGTRTATDSGWLRTAWGGITTSAKVSAGDVINIKAGTTVTSSTGGRLAIDSTYFNNGTAAAPIIIQVSTSWGSGNFTYDFTGITVPAYLAGIHVASRNYIQIKGASGRRFVVLDSGQLGVQAYGNGATHSLGIVFDYLEIGNSQGFGLNMSYTDGFTVSNSLSHDNRRVGFVVGGANDENSNGGTLSDNEAYNNGIGSTDLAHGFGLYGSTNITFIRDASHNNGRDGFDFGTTSNSNDSSATVIDSSSYDNGEDGFGTNGGTSGTPSNLSTYINTVAFNNAQSGWNIYSGARSFLYNCIAHNNGSQSGYGGNFMIYSEALVTTAVLRNCIGYKPKAYANVYSYNSGGLATTIDSDYNIFVPRSSNAEVFAETPFGSAFTYTNKPSWSGPHDKVGIAYAPNFVSVGTTSFASNNYRLASGTGSAANAGVTITGSPASTNDRDGYVRANPPEIGMYEYVTGSGLAAPTNLLVVP